MIPSIQFAGKKIITAKIISSAESSMGRLEIAVATLETSVYPNESVNQSEEDECRDTEGF